MIRRLLLLAALPLAGLPGLPAAHAATPHGMFKTICEFSHRAMDDPIVFPGQPGRAHSHDFFGNTSTDSSSTEPTLRRSGTTCRNSNDKAAYWVPTLYQDGKAVMPKVAQLYYRGSVNDPSTIHSFPAGLKMLAGDMMSTSPQSVDVAAWNCGKTANFQATMPTCRPGDNLRVRIRFPECWDGRHLDSADHRSHMAYAVRGSCPADHPVAVPRLDIEVHYAGPGGAGRVTLASGSWTSAHGDFFNAWDSSSLAGFVQDCLVRPRTCNAV